MRGFFEIGIYQGKTEENLGTLWRSAYQLGAAGVFTIGKRYRRQCSDTLKTWRHIPLRQFETFEEFNAARPYDCQLLAVEMGGTPLDIVEHPSRAIYLLGSEDSGLPPSIIERCQGTIAIESVRTASFNVAVAGALVMYARNISRKWK